MDGLAGADRSTLKVLIVAPNASSRFGGEAFLPLQYFRLLRARGHPVRLVTHARNREDLDDALGRDPRISFVEDSAAHRLVWRVSCWFPNLVRETIFATMMSALDALYQGRMIRRLVREGEVDLIHQPTPVSPLAPSGLHRFGVPLIIGPMNGGMNYPPGYDGLEGPSARRFVALGRLAAWTLNRLVPGKRVAALLLVANARTARALPFADHPRIHTLVENGVDLAAWQSRIAAITPRSTEPGTLRLAFMGRLVDWKLVEVTLEAVGRSIAAGARISLDIIGDGPERRRLKALAASLEINGQVRFHGFLPQGECAPVLAGADALILNSVRECGGAVVLEAMAMGLPVIASDWGGPADYLDDECGILVSPVPRETFAPRLADAILRLAGDPGLRARMGEAGAAKVASDYSWQGKVDCMVALYAEVMARRRRRSPPRVQGLSPPAGEGLGRGGAESANLL